MPTPSFMDGYELANDTIRRFWMEHPHGRIRTTIVEAHSDLEKGYVTFKAEVWAGNFHDDDCGYCKDINKDTVAPAATGHAFGNVATYQPTMKRFYVEDTETSSLARAIKTLSPSSQRPSHEDMVKVEGLTLVPDMPTASIEIQVSEARDPWSFGSVLESTAAQLTAPTAPVSCRHGSMISKPYTRKQDGTEGQGWVCPEKNRDQQCKAIWL